MRKQLADWRLAVVLYLANWWVNRVPVHALRNAYYRRVCRMALSPGSSVHMGCVLYTLGGVSIVPQSVRDYWALANQHYMPGEYVYQFGVSIRAISREQTELLAARVSALHQCAY